MRTLTDLVNEWRLESDKVEHCCIAVAFEKQTQFVMPDTPDPVGELKSLVKAGGTPIGMIGMVKTAKQGTMTNAQIMSRPFKEFDGDEQVEQLLERLAVSMGEQLGHLGAKVSTHRPVEN